MVFSMSTDLADLGQLATALSPHWNRTLLSAIGSMAAATGSGHLDALLFPQELFSALTMLGLNSRDIVLLVQPCALHLSLALNNGSTLSSSSICSSVGEQSSQS